jgi:chaperone required for assembly of F1-ATPase
MKRFWETAGVETSEQGYGILLDRQPMRLPGGAVLRVRGEALALAVAAEWEAAGTAKGGEMSFTDTPLTRLAGTAQERIAPDRWPIVDAIARYGETDMLCYRAEGPESLVRRQQERWDPWLDWVARRYGAPLRVVAGVGPVKQHRGSIAALRAAVGRLDEYGLAGMGVAVPALGSLVLGLALAEGELDAVEAHELGALDELYQIEKWGEDAEAAARRASIAEDIAVAARFMALARA